MLKEQLDKELVVVMDKVNKMEEWCNANKTHKKYEEGCKKITETLKEAAVIYCELNNN